jgi:hypothetical protein
VKLFIQALVLKLQLLKKHSPQSLTKGRSVMGNDDKIVRSKINNLTVICENLWPILYNLSGPLLALCWLSAQAVQECIENQPTNSYVMSVA